MLPKIEQGTRQETQGTRHRLEYSSKTEFEGATPYVQYKKRITRYQISLKIIHYDSPPTRYNIFSLIDHTCICRYTVRVLSNCART